MKHVLTPRVPQLHNRTLSGNIFDQSLGLLHDSLLDGNAITLDSEHANLQIIGKEVSISLEESENLPTDGQGEETKCAENGLPDNGPRNTTDTLASSPEKLACSEDTPGIGMEVVCIGGSDSDVLATVQPVNETEIISSQNGIHPSMSTATESVLTVLHHSPNKTGSRTQAKDDDSLDSDNDGSMQRQILQLLQDACYDLRFPMQRCSNQANRDQTGKRNTLSSGSKKSVISSTDISATSVPSVAGRNRKRASSVTKRGHSRKNAKQVGISKTPIDSSSPVTRIETSKTPLPTIPINTPRKRGRPRKTPVPVTPEL